MDKNIIMTETAPEGWETEQIPLLMQGFTRQTVNLTVPILKDFKPFQLEQFRGVATKLEFISGYLALYVNGVDESFWNDAFVSLKAAGRDLLVKELAERYDYLIDLGRDDDRAINVRLAGGQTIESTLEIDAASLATNPNLTTQLIAYYSTKKVYDWQKDLKWKAGTFVKRQTFRHEVNPGILTVQSFTNVLPKNQGPIIGFQIIILSAEVFNYTISLSVNGQELVKDVWGLKFSRNNPNEPFTFFYPFSAGSTYELKVQNEAIIGNDGIIALTFIFDN